MHKRERKNKERTTEKIKFYNGIGIIFLRLCDIYLSERVTMIQMMMIMVVKIEGRFESAVFIDMNRPYTYKL